MRLYKKWHDNIGNINFDQSKNALSLIGIYKVVQKTGTTLKESVETIGFSKGTTSRPFESLQGKGYIQRQLSNKNENEKSPENLYFYYFIAITYKK